MLCTWAAEVMGIPVAQNAYLFAFSIHFCPSFNHLSHIFSDLCLLSSWSSIIYRCAMFVCYTQQRNCSIIKISTTCISFLELCIFGSTPTQQNTLECSLYFVIHCHFSCSWKWYFYSPLPSVHYLFCWGPPSWRASWKIGGGWGSIQYLTIPIRRWVEKQKIIGDQLSLL